MSDFATHVGTTFPWHELYVGDANKGRDFYCEALGWTKSDMSMGDMGSYAMMGVNGKDVCGVMGTDSDPRLNDVPPHWSVYISVDDVDARLAKCTALGGSVMVPPMDIPNVGRMALIRDPQGATFWLFKSAS